ncbi:SulP family inorganic anion transporter [bacterium endosymbiont of Bathymodiolus sp. 5 South]|jgi:SulP family sulfate permease|uniref:SulP family inorganic anion transporter n=1 Tax=bacterium endosymbiont of Bathymodiolus sp. 5 South TaxID=1181670 RepID=UPI0010B6DD8A|nr:SulP family inorganic anion transporter [bacterium endosymbiont of Bathymodiolus sp. 5 South]CAC9440010.1 Sulfate permease [uncultured Gammaproteobacteria bacterium]SHN89823.1 Sulfate permease [bacterium endosymbiont of Bathymodiolus sp. 5 South]SSC08194.1 Sulfate permease [bacterium endosymbiont of Bathymodiolus sp. 5 South]VVH58167.1 Sulfate permease [uncultured Gammaproteobacteria bacterium]VVH62473.1 Sulfate permease [uncultured Gammaproteobacteria bacterium]
MKTKLIALLPFLAWFKTINKNTIKADIIAGFTGAVVVLPQGVAFATIAGLPPEYGLYTAMVTPIIAALFGSSYHLISGPTTAISIVMFSTISRHVEPGSPEFISMALTLTFLAGVYQFAFGLARFGTLVNFVSHTVIIGFTSGAAILIATSQLKHITGIYVPTGESFLHVWIDLYQGFAGFDIYLLIIALVTLFSAILFKRFLPKSPNLLIGMVLGSVLAFYLPRFGISTNIALVGEIPAHLPPLSMPNFSFSTFSTLASEAFAIALLGLIEAVSISRAVAAKSNQRINPNQEFVGQGLSNIVGSFFSSYAGSGSFTRSGINYESGAKTPLSAIFAALFLMIIVLLIAPLTAYLPIAAMGGVILLVAYNLIDARHVVKIFKYSKSESAILITTFLATLFLELEFAIYLGVLLSLVLFLAKTSTPRIPTLSIDNMNNEGSRNFVNIAKKPLRQCPQLKIIRVDMSIYFGSINHIQKKIEKISDGQNIHHILIVASGINFIDLSGMETLASEHNRLKRKGGGLYFVGLKAPVYQFLAQAHFFEKISRINFFDSKSVAIRTIYRRLERDICTQCDAKIFNECR